jgi:hypothetical protein
VPNALAYFALVAWPMVCLLAFARLKPPTAVLVSLMGAMLWLPEKTEISVPFQPLGKQEIASLSVLVGIALVTQARRQLLASKPLRGAEVWLLVGMVGAFGTSLTNQEPLNYHGRVLLPPLTSWEAVAVCVGDVYTCVIPFVVGRAIFRTREDAKLLLRAFQIGALLYVPGIVIEIALSPQLHNWVYGFAQHDFIQTIRAGGYRPMVFMSHGLGLTLFVAAAVLAGNVLTLARLPTIGRLRGRYVSVVLLIVLLGCKSVGAAVLAFFFTGVLHFMAPRWQLRVLVALSLLVIAYPVSRATDVFPHRALISLTKDLVGTERAQSLEFRFENEEYLSAHAAKKPIFGWGRYRRNMLFESPWRDEPTSIGDGYWINLYGIRGAVGFLSFFALMLTPVFFLRQRLTWLRSIEDRYLLVGLTCMLMMYTLDLLPNGLFTNFPVFFAGALMGLIRGITEAQTTSGGAGLPSMTPGHAGQVWAEPPQTAPGFVSRPVAHRLSSVCRRAFSLWPARRHRSLDPS